MGFDAENHLQPAGSGPVAGGGEPAPLPGVPLRSRRPALRPGQTRQALPHRRAGGRSYRGFNLFDSDDDTLLRVIARGEFNISGLQNKALRRHLPQKNSGQVSRLLKRLRIHGLIKKIGHTYKYYLTRFGKEVITAGLKIRELVLIPQLAFGHVG
jgi:hypothetical protein